MTVPLQAHQHSLQQQVIWVAEMVRESTEIYEAYPVSNHCCDLDKNLLLLYSTIVE